MKSAGGDAAAALLILVTATSRLALSSPSTSAARARSTREFLDRWRTPGDARTKQLGGEASARRSTSTARHEQAWNRGPRKDTGVGAAPESRWHRVAGGRRTTSSSRAPSRARRASNGLANEAGALGGRSERHVDHRQQCGAAEAGARSSPTYLETADARPSSWPSSRWPTAPTCSSSGSPTRIGSFSGPPAPNVRRRKSRHGNAALPYAKFLAWRGTLHGRTRPTASRACSVRRRRRPARGDRLEVRLRRLEVIVSTGAVHLPPARVSLVEWWQRRRHGSRCRWPTPSGHHPSRSPSTVSPTAPSPPVIFAVVDFDGGGRLPDRDL